MKLTAILFLALLAVAQATEPTGPPLFSFYDFLQGEWDVYRGEALLSSGEQSMDGTVRGHYFFEKENGTMNLLGRYYDNDTSSGEITNDMSVLVEFTKPIEGVFKIGASDDTIRPLFGFSFDQQPNPAVGLAAAFGVWHGDKPQFYQFVVAGWDKFFITLIPKDTLKDDETAQVKLYLARRVPVIIEKSFFQKYGMMILPVVFLLFQITKMRNAVQQPQAQQQQQQQRRRQQVQADTQQQIKQMARDRATDSPSGSSGTGSSGGSGGSGGGSGGSGGGGSSKVTKGGVTIEEDEGNGGAAAAPTDPKKKKDL
jgi:heme exporter protein D